MEIKLYKIFNPVTGKYSKGGTTQWNDTNYFWSKKGKTWNELRYVKSHLNLQYRERYERNLGKSVIVGYSPLMQQYIHDNCVIHEYTPSGTNIIPITSLVKEIYNECSTE